MYNLLSLFLLETRENRESSSPGVLGGGDKSRCGESGSAAPGVKRGPREEFLGGAGGLFRVNSSTKRNF